jgi:hypothetical protein
VEGEEQEYFLELLMRKALPEQPKAVLTTEGKMTSAKSKKTRKKEKGVLRGGPSVGAASKGVKKGKTASSASSMKKQVAPDLVRHPEAKGRGVAEGDQEEK